jgi:CheY-like chemotaxis protein
MAHRTLLCVEPDAKDADFIRDALVPYGFEVKTIVNGEQAIEWGKKNPPSLIVVCVEPRKVGYAICNKIKRSDELKDIPLILTSAEETRQTFDQHKKLRSHAEEYILKPLQRNELLSKVKQLTGMSGEIGEIDASATSEQEPAVSADDSEEEISIADGDIVEESRPGTAPRANGGNSGASLFGKGDLDAIFNETEAAFNAIQSPESSDQTGPISTVPGFTATAADAEGESAPPSPWDPDGWNDEATKASSGLPPHPFGKPMAPVPAPAPAPSISPSYADAIESGQTGEDDDVPSPDEVMHPVASNELSTPLAVNVAHDARVVELQGRLHDLETEKHRLLAEIEELKTRLQAQPLSKEKDILSLREIINRKEKDVLDLRDALDAKERQILDHKDRVRENERARRDLEEKMLGFEKSLVAANERVTALSHDKEKATERERGNKARLDDALTEIQKAHEEVETFKRRAQSAEERARGDVDRVRGELESRLREAEEASRAEIARLSEERTGADAAREREHQAEVARLEAARVTEVEVLQKRLAEELASQTERAAGEAQKLRRDHDKALASLKEEQAVQLAAERQAHQAALEAKERDLRNELLGARRRHEEELAAGEERRQKELADLEAKRVAELEAAEQRRRAELQTRDEEHHTAVAEMDRRYFEEKTAMGERHRAEVDQANNRAARAEGELAARSEELAEAARRLSTRDTDLDALRADVRDSAVKLAQARERATELEGKTAELEEQILRAYQKLRGDEKMLDKAKRALAVALSLLDGSSAQPQAAAPAASAPATPAASAPAPVVAARPSEESTT